jgi:peptide/nickel transport system ATP-binding protein
MSVVEERADAAPAAPEQAPAALDVRDLEVTFHRRGRRLPVLKGVTLSIARGQAYGLVGESGCGKTTLAMAAMRYLAANGTLDNGRVLVDGQDVSTLSEEALRKWRGGKVSMVYQDPTQALSPAMRIGDQLAEVYHFHEGLDKKAALERARESLRRVAIPDPDATLRRYPFELSGGQQQRVVIAMALSVNPRLLILDEPTTGLDATVEAEILDLIEELRGRINAAILLITHNLGLVARLCERVGVLYAGRLVEEGPARDIFTDPRHPYTMGLLRCVPRFGMNKTDAALQTIPGTLPALGEPLQGCVYSARCPMARPVCTRREPDLYAWPGDDATLGCAQAEAMEPDPEAYSPHHANPVGEGARHARCYFSAQVTEMPKMVPVLSKSLEDRGGRDEVLHIDDVQRTFKDGRKKLTAVYHASLALKRGETFGLVGESGSGKTTLAKCVTGLLAPDSGTITFEGGVLRPTSGKRSQDALRAIQMVFQNPDSTLNPAWSTRAILTRAVRKLGGAHGGDVRAKVDSISAGVRVEPRFLLQRPTELSGGQKQRIAIARAFAGDPTLVVCDEPASALDVSVQASILNLLVELQTREKVSYVFISHDLAVVRYISDRIGVMYLAQLIEVGSSEDVFRAPHHPYTEALLSSIPKLDFDNPSQRIPLRGTMPSLTDPPSGCRFHTRCHRFLGDICVNQDPPEQEAGDGHIYACHIPPDELLRLQTEGTTASGEGAVLVGAQTAALQAEMAEAEESLSGEQPAPGDGSGSRQA